MSKIRVIILYTVGLLFVTLFACRKRDKSPLIPAGPPEKGEVITTAKIIYTDSATGVSKSFFFADIDGPGGKPAFYGPGDGTQSDSVIILQPGTVYNVQLLFLNQSVSPADTVSTEVRAEGEEHMVFYDNGNSIPLGTLGPANVTLEGGTEVIYIDSDAQQNSIGLLTRWKVGSGSHLLRITLKHQHDGKSGDVTVGESEIEVYFRLII